MVTSVNCKTFMTPADAQQQLFSSCFVYFGHLCPICVHCPRHTPQSHQHYLFTVKMSQFANYKPIISKLRKKKSLLRKTPNLNEVSDELISLGNQLKEFPNYSAYCTLAASRIEHSNNSSATSTETEFDHLLVAARKFDRGGDINSAISCYR